MWVLYWCTKQLPVRCYIDVLNSYQLPHYISVWGRGEESETKLTTNVLKQDEKKNTEKKTEKNVQSNQRIQNIQFFWW